jgi:tellurite resistance protein
MSSIQKAVYMNLTILALADGRVDPSEADFLHRFAASSDISDDLQQKWQHEVQAQALQFVPIDTDDDRTEALAMLARMVRVDGEFDPREQDAYLFMGKALGYTDEELGNALRKYWNEDPDVDFAKVFNAQNDVANTSYPTILAIRDDQTDLEKLEISANQCRIQYCNQSDISAASKEYNMILFQTAETPKQSLERLQMLQRHFPDTPVAFIARRDQAPQIGYLLEHGARKCFVKPLFPNEVNKAVMTFFASAHV